MEQCPSAQEDISCVLSKLVRVRTKSRSEVLQLAKSRLDREYKFYVRLLPDEENVECCCSRNCYNPPPPINMELTNITDLPTRTIPSVRVLEKETLELISELDNYRKIVDSFQKQESKS